MIGNSIMNLAWKKAGDETRSLPRTRRMPAARIPHLILLFLLKTIVGKSFGGEVLTSPTLTVSVLTNQRSLLIKGANSPPAVIGGFKQRPLCLRPSAYQATASRLH